MKLFKVGELVDEDSEKVLAKTAYQMCRLDESFKLAPLPQLWKEKYTKTLGKNVDIVVPSIIKPDKTHVYEVKLSWSDIGSGNYIRYNTHVKHCIDATMNGIYHKAFSKLVGDISHYHIGKVTIAYKTVLFPEDKLMVHVWEDPENPFKLHFHLEKDGKLAVQITITYIEA